MKNLAIFILFFSFTISAQNYSKVDQMVKNYPLNFNNIDELANRINSDFNIDEEKIRALYSWLSLNIKYDSSNDIFDINDYRITYYNLSDKKRQLKRRKINRLEKKLKTKKAACIDYSEIFKEVCDRIGILSEVVIGYSKTTINDIENDKSYKNHAWNAVKINGNWQLIDITWASVAKNEIFSEFYDYYYFTKPEEFILTHYPIDSKWQLLRTKVSKIAFFKSPLFYTKYFIDEFKMSSFQKGIIEINRKRLEVYFDSIPRNKKLFYRLDGDTYITPLNFKKTKNGNYVTSIKYKNNENSSLYIYSDFLPVLAFKIKSSL